MFRPSTFIIANFIMRRIVGTFNFNKVFIKIFSSLFSVSSNLIFTIGVIPTIRVLYRLRSYILRGLPLPTITILLPAIGNSHVTRTIIETIQPFWNDCIKQPKIFNRLYWLFFIFTIFGSFRPITLSISKFIFGLIFSCLGIAYNETLSTFTGLKLFSDWILDTLNFNSFMSNNTIKQTGKVVLDNVSDELLDNSSLGWLSIMAITIIGLSGTVILLIVSDYYAPEVVRSVPYLGSLTDSIYSFLNGVIHWFYGFDSLQPSPPDTTINLPDVVSRSSSGGSTITIGQTIPTPPATPTPQIPLNASIILENYGNVISDGILDKKEDI